MKTKQQQYGQYFTDNNQVNDIVEILKQHSTLTGECLEPSFGDGAFIDVLKDYNLNIDAYEIDIEIYKDKFNLFNVNLFNKDFIYDKITKKYNFIVGNPPYIELTYSFYTKEQQQELNKLYKESCDGRMNLTHIFIYKCLELLEEDGILAFLVPSSILTSPYYNKIREIIHQNFNILHIKNDVNFKDVAIKVSLIVIKKTNKITEDFILKYGKNIYFSENIQGFPKEIVSLKDEGFKVNIGEVVWNQHKEKLTNENAIGTKTLIYSTHIGKNELNLVDIKNLNKKKHIYWNNIKHKDCILMPRTITKKLKYYYLKDNVDYVFENHVLIITNKDKSKLDRLFDMLDGGELDKYIGLYFNSSNLSAEEVLNLPYNEIY